MTAHLLKNLSLSLILIYLSIVGFSQVTEQPVTPFHFNGAVSVTNNGISFIPNLSLGKPAAIFDLSMGKGKISFEPQFRFSLEGKPWSFIFWWRYNFVRDKFQFTAGAHPAISFRTVPADSVRKEEIVVQRFIAGELSPNWLLTNKISLGLYYFFGYGIEKESIKYTQMIALRSSFSNIMLADNFSLRFAPEIYYLRIDKRDGFYFSSSLTLAKKNFPISVSSIINQPIRSGILAGNSFIWNVSLIYTFNNNYEKR